MRRTSTLGAARLITGVVLVVLTGASCAGAKRLQADEARDRLETACAAFAELRPSRVVAVAGPAFTRDSLDELPVADSDAYELIGSINGPAEQRTRLNALTVGIDEMMRLRAEARTDLEGRKWAEAQQNLDDGVAAAATVDDLAGASDLAACGASTWVGDWFGQAQRHLDEQVLATAPTGDFVVDVQAACTRLSVDVNQAPIPLSLQDVQTWALTVRSALGFFARDVTALPVPAEQFDGVNALSDAIDRLTDELDQLVGYNGPTSGNKDDLIAAVQVGVDDVLARIADLGADC